MTDNVIDLDTRSLPVTCLDDAGIYGEFLLAEELQLVAFFRSIDDVVIRTSILAMVKAIAARNITK